MASAAFQKEEASVATPGAVNSIHMTQTIAWLSRPVEAKIDAWTAVAPESPCITVGATCTTVATRMAPFHVACDHATFGVRRIQGNVYGDHYRNANLEVEPENVLCLGRAKKKILHAIEELVREKLRRNPLQSKQQNHITVFGIALADPEGFGNVYLIKAPDGSCSDFFKADKAHKASANLARWYKDPKNKNKDNYKPLTTTTSNAVTAFEVIHELLGAGWSASVLDEVFRGSHRIVKASKQLLDEMLSQTDEFGEETLMATTWKTHFQIAGPEGSKYKIAKENLTAAVCEFLQRTVLG